MQNTIDFDMSVNVCLVVCFFCCFSRVFNCCNIYHEIDKAYDYEPHTKAKKPSDKSMDHIVYGYGWFNSVIADWKLLFRKRISAIRDENELYSIYNTIQHEECEEKKNAA